MKILPILTGSVLAIAFIQGVTTLPISTFSLLGTATLAVNGSTSTSLFLNKSDVLFSPRVYRDNWQENYTAFGANRIVWTYEGMMKYAAIGKTLGIPVQCALPTRVPATVPTITRTPDGTVTTVDPSDPKRTVVFWSNQTNAKFTFIPVGTPVTVGTTTYATVADTTVGNLNLPKTASITVGANVYVLTTASSTGMACIKRSGETIAPYGSVTPSADVNSPAFRAYVLDNAQKHVDAGCRAFHQDEPDMNWHQTKYYDGCYGDDSISGFNTYLKERLSPTKLSSLGIENIDTFNYRTQKIIGAQKLSTLKKHFEEFQKKSVIDFQNWLHRSVARYAEVKYAGAKTSFSGNFSDGVIEENQWLMGSFDFNLAELYPTRDTALELTRKMATSARSKFSRTSGITIASTDVWINQRVIASAYPQGLTVIAPWDVYISGTTTPRFYGSPADFSNLFSMIRSNRSLFDDYSFQVDSVTASEVSAIPAAGAEIPDGFVTKVDTAFSPGKVTIFWTNQLNSNLRNISYGTPVMIGKTTYSTVSGATAGNLYLPVGANVSVGDPVKLNTPASENTVDGYVTSVDPLAYPNRVTVFWDNQLSPNLRNIPYGTQVAVGTTTYGTVSNATGGNIYLPTGAVVSVGDPVNLPASFGTQTQTLDLSSSVKAVGLGSYYIAVSKNNTDGNKRAVHVVNWGTQNPAATTLMLRAKDFPTRPSYIVTSANPTPVSITPTLVDGNLVYQLGDVNIWSFVY